MTPVPRIARVQILWSENRAVKARAYPSLAAADAALAAAFAEAPAPEQGYDKTKFLVVWVDGQRHEGRVDVRDVDVRTAAAAGGILRQHLGNIVHWLRDERAAKWWTPEERAESAAWSDELRRRLDTEPPLCAARNLDHVPADHLLPIGTTVGDLAVTLLPDPLATVANLEAHFAAIRPSVAVWMGHGRTVPRTTNRDVRYAANWLSLALANDMPRLRAITGRPHGVIWDRWAKTIEHVRRHLGTDADATYRDSAQFWNDQVPHLAHKVAGALQGDGPRNAEPFPGHVKKVTYRVIYRAPGGGTFATDHAATDHTAALRAARRRLGYTPDVVRIEATGADHQWSVL